MSQERHSATGLLVERGLLGTHGLDISFTELLRAAGDEGAATPEWSKWSVLGYYANIMASALSGSLLWEVADVMRCWCHSIA